MPHPPEIVVVGAGIIGCAVAYELARRGAGVQVVDERAPGMGATQASAGMLAPYNETADGSPLFALAVRSLDMYEDFVSRRGGRERPAGPVSPDRGRSTWPWTRRR